MRRVAIAQSISIIACLLTTQAFGQFYHPDRREYQTPRQQGLAFESVQFESADKTKLHGWFLAAKGKALGTVIHFHGNAQNLTAHFSFVEWLPRQGFNLFLFDYRGYGKSKGRPTRSGVHQDAIAALRYIKTRQDIDQDKLLVFGQSLGGAVAISAIGRMNVRGLRSIAVESTFDSYEAIAKEKVPDILAGLFVSDKLSPDSVIANIAPIPIVFIHGTSDRVVPYRRGKALFEKAEQPKTMWTVRGGRHTEAFTRYGTTYRPRLVTFFKECLKEEERTR